MAWLQAFLVKYPELAVFLVIAVGYVIGNVKVKGIGLGPVTGSLFAGLLIGQVAQVPVSAMTKSFLFLLFLFGIGYSVGPSSSSLSSGTGQSRCPGLRGRLDRTDVRRGRGKVSSSIRGSRRGLPQAP